MSDKAMLHIRSLKAWYGNVQALHDIDLHVEQGELVSLIGANGAGKSTTLKCIAGLMAKGQGEILFEGRHILGMNPSDVVKAGIALVPEGRWVFGDLTVEENLLMGGFSRSKRETAESLVEQFDLFPILKERKAQKAGTLSGGEQQMLSIARALMSKPRLLLMDEPSLGLAPQVVETVFSLIRHINEQGVALLLVEQNSKAALSIADRGYVFSTGRVQLEGTGDELLRSPKVQEAYLGNKIAV
jgi:branched-chain amino acid transport system ATP-binding protein